MLPGSCPQLLCDSQLLRARPHAPNKGTEKRPPGHSGKHYLIHSDASLNQPSPGFCFNHRTLSLPSLTRRGPWVHTVSSSARLLLLEWLLVLWAVPTAHREALWALPRAVEGGGQGVRCWAILVLRGGEGLHCTKAVAGLLDLAGSVLKIAPLCFFF